MTRVVSYLDTKRAAEERWRRIIMARHRRRKARLITLVWFVGAGLIILAVIARACHHV